ncbi:hypothetical protein RI367_006893 [Sorochytrium milnesiophthora]
MTIRTLAATILRRGLSTGSSVSPELVSVSTRLRQEDGVAFPWLWNDQLPRMTRDEVLFPPSPPYTQAQTPSLFERLLSRPLTEALARAIADRFLATNLGATYYPDKFLTGAAQAAKPIVEALSYSPAEPLGEQQARVRALYTEEFADRITDEFGALAQLKNVGVEILVDNVADAHIDNVALTVRTHAHCFFEVYKKLRLTRPGGSVRPQFGQKRITQAKINKTRNPNYMIARWVTHTVGTTVAPEDGGPAMGSAFSQKALLDGFQATVDVHIKADVAATVYRLNNNSSSSGSTETTADPAQRIPADAHPLHHEYSSMRTLSVRFTSPYFEPSDTISRTGPGGLMDRQWDWDWRVSDIDYLMTSSKREELRQALQARARAEEEAEDD